LVAAAKGAANILVLTRRIHEVLCIGPNVQVEILGMNGIQVKIGIRAPKDVSVDRLEIRQRKDAGKSA
jgi:carbon storage regulator